MQAFYRQSSRELRRLSSVARSPVYSGFSEALDGAPTIRGFSAQAPFSQQNVDALEVLQQANFAGELCGTSLRGSSLSCCLVCRSSLASLISLLRL